MTSIRPSSSRLLAAGLAAVAVLALSHHTLAASAGTAASPCTSDSSFQRLAFWVGDWDVLDSTGKHYASQRVRPVVDGCALSAEWTGPNGDKGLSITAYDPRTHDWKQVYVFNQVPRTGGVSLRKSDPSYAGPGVRFIPIDAGEGNATQLRITIAPAADGRVYQRFEDTNDGGLTWHKRFTGEYRAK